MKNYSQAISYLEKAVVVNPENLEYQYNLAVLYDKNSQYERALELYSLIAKNSADNSAIPVDQIRNRIESIKNKIYS